MTQFHCTADQCQANCCHGWTVPLDDEDFARIQMFHRSAQAVTASRARHADTVNLFRESDWRNVPDDRGPRPSEPR